MTAPMIMVLESSIEEPGRARKFVRETLHGVPTDACEDAVVMISELVTNVVLHGATPARVEINLSPPGARIRVFDSGPPFTAPGQVPSTTAGSGRGLLIVAGLARSWGVDADGSGKSVWFEI